MNQALQDTINYVNKMVEPSQGRTGDIVIPREHFKGMFESIATAAYHLGKYEQAIILYAGKYDIEPDEDEE